MTQQFRDASEVAMGAEDRERAGTKEMAPMDDGEAKVGEILAAWSQLASIAEGVEAFSQFLPQLEPHSANSNGSQLSFSLSLVRLFPFCRLCLA